MFKRALFPTFFAVFSLIIAISLSSCDADTIINNVISNEVSAKDRLAAAITQAKTDHGDSTNLVLIFGKNVNAGGKTELSALSAITNPDSIGAWLYLFKAPSDTSLRIYTPNPLPTASGVIELTSFFNVNTIIGLIQDTSAQNIISGALDIIINSNVKITTSTGNLLDSPTGLDLANNTNPVIKFDQNFAPDTSSLNGSAFFSTGSNKSRNMILIPAAGTLNLPVYITQLTGFPADLWIVNYSKTNATLQTENLILGTVVESNQIMGIPFLGLTSKVINISKYVTN